MAKDPIVNYEELVLANAVSINAILNVLECKGVLTRKEVIAEVDALKKQMDDEVRRN